MSLTQISIFKLKNVFFSPHWCRNFIFYFVLAVSAQAGKKQREIFFDLKGSKSTTSFTCSRLCSLLFVHKSTEICHILDADALTFPLVFRPAERAHHQSSQRTLSGGRARQRLLRLLAGAAALLRSEVDYQEHHEAVVPPERLLPRRRRRRTVSASSTLPAVRQADRRERRRRLMRQGSRSPAERTRSKRREL